MAGKILWVTHLFLERAAEAARTRSRAEWGRRQKQQAEDAAVAKKHLEERDK